MCVFRVKLSSLHVAADIEVPYYYILSTHHIANRYLVYVSEGARPRSQQLIYYLHKIKNHAPSSSAPYYHYLYRRRARYERKRHFIHTTHRLRGHNNDISWYLHDVHKSVQDDILQTRQKNDRRRSGRGHRFRKRVLYKHNP